MSLSPRTIVLSGIGLALLGALVITAVRDDPIPVDLHRIAHGTLTVTVDADGETRVRQRFDINAPITGSLLRMPLEVGDPVVAGETVIARIEPVAAPLLDARSRAEAVAALNDAEAQIRFAEAEIIRTKASAGFAQAQLDRAKALAGTGTVSITRVEDTANQVALAEAEVVSAQARLSMAHAAKERAEAVLRTEGDRQADGVCCVHMTAPATGVILSQINASARPVVAGENLASIGDPDDLEIVVDLLSGDATRIVEGARVSVERWGGEAALMGEVRRIEPTARTVVSALGIEEQRVDARIDFTSPKDAWSGLGHGFAVFVRIEEWHEKDVLLVPLSAVFQKEGAWFTFRVDGDTARLTPIAIGRRDGRVAVVVSGLEGGDAVITHPSDAIEDGRRIAERERF